MAATYSLLTASEAAARVASLDVTKVCPHCLGEGDLYELRQEYDVIVKGALTKMSRDDVFAGLGRASVIQWRPSETHGPVLWAFFDDTAGFGIVGLVNEKENPNA